MGWNISWNFPKNLQKIYKKFQMFCLLGNVHFFATLVWNDMRASKWWQDFYSACQLLMVVFAGSEPYLWRCVLVVHVCFVLFFQSPWGPPVLAPAPCSLADVMSEQLARQLDEEGSPFPEIPEWVSNTYISD